MEIEVPVKDPRSFSNITRHNHHILQLETVLMTIYYPSAFGSGQGKSPAGDSHWSRETWLPRPRLSTAHGYGIFAGVGPLAVPLFAATSMFTKLPAFRNAALAQHWPPFEDMHSGGIEVKNRSGPPPDGEPAKPVFPLMIFSHGLGGSRTMYSSMCGEFASYGFICAAVEHRDGSGPRTYVNYAKEGEGSQSEREEHDGIDHTPKSVKKKHDAIDYIFPKGNRMDTTPNNDKGVDRELRNGQINLRLAEIEEAHYVLCEIVNGKGKEIEAKNLRQKGYVGSSTKGLIGVDWNSWKGRFHCERVTVLGHSFGAATTVEILRKSKRFDWVSQGIIYDIWGAAIKDANPDKNENENRINLPLLAINSEAFSYWESNYTLVHSLVEEAREQGALAWLLTVRGTVHVNQSDFSLLYPHVCSLALKMTADPQRALDLNIDASLEFLKIVMPSRIAQINRAMRNEGLLETKAVENFDDLPEVRRPAAKFTAARLTIPHEFRYRFSPTQILKRRRRRRTEGAPGFEGLGNPKEELWMHMAPSKKDLEKHGVKSAEQRKNQGNEGNADHGDDSGVGDALTEGADNNDDGGTSKQSVPDSKGKGFSMR